MTRQIQCEVVGNFSASWRGQLYVLIPKSWQYHTYFMKKRAVSRSPTISRPEYCLRPFLAGHERELFMLRAHRKEVMFVSRRARCNTIEEMIMITGVHHHVFSPTQPLLDRSFLGPFLAGSPSRLNKLKLQDPLATAIEPAVISRTMQLLASSTTKLQQFSIYTPRIS